jgi:hypothetical protein
MCKDKPRTFWPQQASAARRSSGPLVFKVGTSNNMNESKRLASNLLLYKKLVVSQDDFGQAKYFIGYILKKGWHFSPWDSAIRYPTYLKQAAFTTAFVTAYARPFTGTRSSPALSLKIAKYGISEKRLHDEILELRNTVYAHSDIEKQDVRPLVFMGFASAVQKQPVMKFSKLNAELVLRMVESLSEHVRARLNLLAKELNVEN